MFMLQSLYSSAIKVYQSTPSTILDGTTINFIEYCDEPIIFSVLSGYSLSIYMINSDSTAESFISDLHNVCNEFNRPIYLFEYDIKLLKKYETKYKSNLFSYFTSYGIKKIENKRYSLLEDFYSFTVPEYYYSFFTNAMYVQFAKTGDIAEIINFVRSIMFSKQVLLIDELSTYKISSINKKKITLTIQGKSIIRLPENACLMDIQTTGLEEDSTIISFSFYKNNSFVRYCNDDNSLEERTIFREFINHNLESYDIIYVFSPSFVKIFFPHGKNLIDIKFNKYKYFVTSRKLVHLPYYHLEYDPGCGKNVPIWFNLSKKYPDQKWRQLIFQRIIVNVLTKIAILSSNELSVPFNDNIVADIRKVRPTTELLNQFNSIKKDLISKKVCYYPTELFNTYTYANGEFAEMYLDQMIRNEKEE